MFTSALKYKKYLFGATAMVKNNDREKDMYGGYETALMERVFGILVTTMLRML